MGRLDLDGSAFFGTKGFNGFANASQVVIVGAGISGLVFAFEMSKRGIPPSQIRFLEAQEHGGGRIETIEHGGRSFECGAGWFHGGKNNLLYKWLEENVGDQLAQRWGVEKFKHGFATDRLKPVSMIDEDGIFNKKSYFRFSGYELTQRNYEAFKQKHPDQDIPLSHLRHDEFLRRHSDVDVPLAAGETLEDRIKLTKGFLKINSGSWMASDPDLISADELYSEGSGSGGLIAKFGNASITDGLQDMLKEMGVKFDYSHEVASVKTSEAYSYEVNCRNGKTLHAQTVYVTPSIAALKNIDIPCLTEQAREKIDSYFMSELKRMLVPLKKRFFRDYTDIEPNERVDIMNAGKSFFAHIHTAGRASMQFVGTNDNLAERGQSDEARTQFAESAVGTLFPNIRQYLKAAPRNVDWSSGRRARLFGGAYSNSKVGTSRTPEPIVIDGLIIGGEAFASNAKGGATMEGAKESAVCAAMHAAKWLGCTAAPQISLLRRLLRRATPMRNVMAPSNYHPEHRAP